MWQSSKEQHNQHLILLLDLIKEVQKTPENAAELVEKTKSSIKPNTTTNPDSQKPTENTDVSDDSAEYLYGPHPGN